MSINFPNSPTIGQTYTFGNKTWEWNGSAWTLLDTITDASKFATTGSNTFTGNQAISASLGVTGGFTASGLLYPDTDGLEFQVITTDGAGTLTFDDVHTIYEDVYTGEAITKGDPLYINGAQGDKPVVYIADAADSGKMPVTFIASETIGAGQDTRGIVLGLISGIDLTGIVAGTEVYVGEGGGWATTKPTGSSSITQLLGIVTKGDSPGGKGLVLNPGPSNLPGLQTGYLWVGNGDNQPTIITTSSLNVATSVSASHALNADDAISASYAPTILPDGTVSSSAQVDYTQLQNIPNGIVSSSTQATEWSVASSSVAISASFAVTSSQADNVKVLTSASYAAITPVSGTIYIVTE